MDPDGIVKSLKNEPSNTARIAVFETIGCALATLGRLDHVWYDADIRNMITKARASLSVAQSKIKERLAE